MTTGPFSTRLIRKKKKNPLVPQNCLDYFFARRKLILRFPLTPFFALLLAYRIQGTVRGGVVCISMLWKGLFLGSFNGLWHGNVQSVACSLYWLCYSGFTSHCLKMVMNSLKHDSVWRPFGIQVFIQAYEIHFLLVICNLNSEVNSRSSSWASFFLCTVQCLP